MNAHMQKFMTVFDLPIGSPWFTTLHKFSGPIWHISEKKHVLYSDSMSSSRC